jgi:hypothetical protein
MEKINLDRFKNCIKLNFKDTIAAIQFKGHAVFWSWGARAFTNIEHKALRFYVNGRFHKGHVYISVNGKDLYDVVFTTSMGTIKKEMNDIFCEDLAEIIDNIVETNPKVYE